MVKKSVSVYFPDKLLEKLDAKAKGQYRSRMSVILEACEKFVGGE